MSDEDTGAGASPPFVATATAPFRIGDWTVDPTLDEISRDGETVKLEPRKMLLLVALARRPGEVATPDQLLDAVWPGLVVTQSSLYQSVAQLRKTLGDNRATPEYIATVPRKGYRLVAPVGPANVPRALVARDVVAEPAVLPDATAPVLPVPLPIEPGRARFTRRRVLLGGGVTAVAVAVAAAGFGWWRLRGVAPSDAVVRVAVLPFSDQSNGKLEQAAADGLANDVIRRFERSDDVVVLARNSTFTFRGFTADRSSLKRLADELDADYALLGELFRLGRRVRVTIRLLAVATGKAVWSSVITKDDDRMAEVPGMVASGALRALGLSDGPSVALDPLQAYELYLLGLNALQTQRSMEGLKKAREYFQHAIDTDPTYARAYAGVATTWLSQSTFGIGTDAREAGARAQPLIDKALSLDPNLLEGLMAQARLYMLTNWGEVQRAQVLMEKAVSLYPGSAEARFGLGASFAFDAKPREAIKHYAAALELDPLNSLIHSRWGQDATFAGDFEAARVHFARSATLTPKYPWRFLGPAQAFYAQGRLDDAVANYRLQFEQDERRADAHGEVGRLYLDLGMPAAARAAFQKRVELAGSASFLGVDACLADLAEGKPESLPETLRTYRLDQPFGSQWDVDRLTVLAIAGRLPTAKAVADLEATMRADAVPWVGSYWIFLGTFALIDFAALYDLAGAKADAARLCDEAATTLARLAADGNAFHTIPYYEARIAALRGQRDVAITRLTRAVDLGWRRAWMIRHDPSLRTIRDDSRIAPLVARVRSDMDRQRAHLG